MVLAAGGSGVTAGKTASAELFNPNCGWIPTGALHDARDNHTATLLSTGKVLVAGGDTGSAALASAELYDPGTRSWLRTGSMSVPRESFTATLLPNGKVLVAGGGDRYCAVACVYTSSELYDPVSGTWSTTGSLNDVHLGSTATLLQNGRVLLAGGAGAQQCMNCPIPVQKSAELYDPATGTWSSTGSMATGRQAHTATLFVNGKVLVAGGGTANGNQSPTALAEIYDPSSAMWTPTGPMMTPRVVHTATLLPNGTVLVAGGGDGSGLMYSSAELYSPTTGTWSFTASMRDPRWFHRAIWMNNGVMVIGGPGGGPAHAEFYLP
jgi:N-acetylneuraminic acid mutarotase